MELGEQIGVEHAGPAALFRNALVEAHRGNTEAARTAAEQGAALSDAAQVATPRLMNLGVLGFLLLVFKEPPRSLGESSDQLWHRWEEGDITRYEFERLRRAGQTHLGARGAGN